MLSNCFSVRENRVVDFSFLFTSSKVRNALWCLMIFFLCGCGGPDKYEYKLDLLLSSPVINAEYPSLPEVFKRIFMPIEPDDKAENWIFVPQGQIVRMDAPGSIPLDIFNQEGLTHRIQGLVGGDSYEEIRRNTMNHLSSLTLTGFDERSRISESEKTSEIRSISSTYDNVLVFIDGENGGMDSKDFEGYPVYNNLVSLRRAILGVLKKDFTKKILIVYNPPITKRRAKPESDIVGESSLLGTITDGSNAPLKGVTIYSTSKSITRSAADGTYEIKLKSGSNTVIFRKSPYDEIRKNIVLEPGETYSMDIVMESPAKDTAAPVQKEERLDEIRISSGNDAFEWASVAPSYLIEFLDDDDPSANKSYNIKTSYIAVPAGLYSRRKYVIRVSTPNGQSVRRTFQLKEDRSIDPRCK